MGRQARLRKMRRTLPPMRVVPSRRGLAVVFTAVAAVGLAVGLFASRFVH